MSYIILILGVLLWSLAHLFKRIAPGVRARMGKGAKGLVALALVAAVVLMVIGYRATDFIPVWYPPPFLTHVNNLLMLFAVYVFGVGAAKGKLSGVIRHPQLTAVKIWAVAHLLVNGDLAAIILFGGLLAWAVVEVIVINRAEPSWVRPADTSWKGDAKAVVIGLVIFVVATAIHYWLGVNPFGA
ncbi:putative membrane protein [Jannaschia seosinensis]|uniref:Putative membrane protein n=1 Tax=Jannaschia seosinensis TaxID=313367 RepID=A0A0M7B8Z8_9RHOB|nr:NnrU family protein [Jannaschia seosinensis]CUH38851.1 putative membrane protein [Jannaschia seosinensis]